MKVSLANSYCNIVCVGNVISIHSGNGTGGESIYGGTFKGIYLNVIRYNFHSLVPSPASTHCNIHVCASVAQLVRAYA